MNRQLLLLIAVYLLILYWFIKFRHHIWIARGRAQPNIAKRRRKNKSLPYPFSILRKRSDHPLRMSEKCKPQSLYQLSGNHYATYLSRGYFFVH